LKFNKSFGQKFSVLAANIARKNAFHPIQTYLEGMAGRHGDSTEILDYLAESYVGQSAAIYQTLIRKTLADYLDYSERQSITVSEI
jgi:predicted P-loop ATPase